MSKKTTGTSDSHPNEVEELFNDYVVKKIQNHVDKQLATISDTQGSTLNHICKDAENINKVSNLCSDISCKLYELAQNLGEAAEKIPKTTDDALSRKLLPTFNNNTKLVIQETDKILNTINEMKSLHDEKHNALTVQMDNHTSTLKKDFCTKLDDVFAQNKLVQQSNASAITQSVDNVSLGITSAKDEILQQVKKTDAQIQIVAEKIENSSNRIIATVTEHDASVLKTLEQTSGNIEKIIEQQISTIDQTATKQFSGIHDSLCEKLSALEAIIQDSSSRSDKSSKLMLRIMLPLSVANLVGLISVILLVLLR